MANRRFVMKKFACGDVVPGCDASWVCSSEDDILANVAAHAAADHGLVEVSAELVSAVRANIISVG
jgi:predicted small metal-binding protein